MQDPEAAPTTNEYFTVFLSTGHCEMSVIPALEH
jgi:hypothetical protein